MNTNIISRSAVKSKGKKTPELISYDLVGCVPTLDTVKSFSEYSKISQVTMYRLIHAEGFPIIRTSPRGRVLIKREDAVKYLERFAI